MSFCQNVVVLTMTFLLQRGAHLAPSLQVYISSTQAKKLKVGNLKTLKQIVTLPLDNFIK